MTREISDDYNDFFASIIKNDAKIADYLIKENSKMSPQEQLAIYIDGYRIRLYSAILSDYPELNSYMDKEQFDKILAGFIEANMSQSFNLDIYPHKFAEFLKDKLDDDFAIDLAYLENAIAVIFNATNTFPLEPSLLSNLSEEDLGNMVLKPRGASKLMGFKYQINEWFNKKRAGENLELPLKEAEFMYIYRHNNNVKREVLVGAEYLFLKQIFSGTNVLESLDVVMKQNPANSGELVANLQHWFAKWFSLGFFS